MQRWVGTLLRSFGLILIAIFTLIACALVLLLSVCAGLDTGLGIRGGFIIGLIILTIVAIGIITYLARDSRR